MSYNRAAARRLDRREIAQAGRTQSFESVKDRRAARDESKRLTPEEIAELRLYWGGYEAVGDCRSAMGAVMDAALRAPPRERIAWRLVEDELNRSGGQQAVDRLVWIIADNGEATPHEVRLAIRGMCGTGSLTKDVVDLQLRDESGRPRRDAEDRPILGPTQVVRLAEHLRQAPSPRLKPEERWARADAELEEHTRGYIRCSETRSAQMKSRGRNVNIGAMQFEQELPIEQIRGLDRCVLERVYGTAFHAPYVEEFGRELAPVVEYTRAAVEAGERLERQTGRRPTFAETMRAVLDAAPTTLAAKVRWQEARTKFIAQAKRDATKLLEQAVASYRAKRWPNG